MITIVTVLRDSKETTVKQVCRPTCIFDILDIYAIILLKLCRCSQTAGRNSCSIVLRDVSHCSYLLTVHHVTSSRLSSA